MIPDVALEFVVIAIVAVVVIALVRAIPYVWIAIKEAIDKSR